MKHKIAASIVSAIILSYFSLYGPYNHLISLYKERSSALVYDRNSEDVYTAPNAKGYYTKEIESIPEDFKNLLIKKEDKFFYYHKGINPFSILRSVAEYVRSKKFQGSSTITQQLAKNLLGNETERTFKNKLNEVVYTLALEAYAPKDEILKMYANIIYFGNNVQGLEEASNYYFNKSSSALSKEEILQLLGTISNPSNRYPGTYKNKTAVKNLAYLLGADEGLDLASSKPEENNPAPRKDKTFFEIENLNASCEKNCELTIDKNITEELRSMLSRNLDRPSFASVENGAITVIKLPENEVLAIIGSPDPQLPDKGYQINMAKEPRPIGSTIKPFIYLNAFEKGVRPYTLVDDREYKYSIGTGFAFYPKNYDGKYHGIMTLHQALSNSMNVPSVKVLEFVGLDDFYDFLLNKLNFLPINPLPSYKLGIALGGLEMDLLTLSKYFTIFPNEGILKPLVIAKENGKLKYLNTPMSQSQDNEIRITDEPFVELINKILSDRKTGVDQFGIESNLNLPYTNYALKTGTSRDFHDSWTIGYTPDFLVGVWLGNSKNTPMQQVSGQTGAGIIWREAMEIMYNSDYNHGTPFKLNNVKEYKIDNSIEFGLAGDDVKTIRNIMNNKNTLITSPHGGDVFLFQKGMGIPLTSAEKADWFVNDSYVSSENNFNWKPAAAGQYEITAKTKSSSETLIIYIDKEENDL
jgi:membrane carboxypeptidase/penicillin-binding protein PbpC